MMAITIAAPIMIILNINHTDQYTPIHNDNASNNDNDNTHKHDNVIIENRACRHACISEVPEPRCLE